MFSVAAELRCQLWHVTDWASRIRERAHALLGSTFEAQEAADLARWAEAIVPEEGLAIELYTGAWRAHPHAAWIDRAALLADELGDFHKVAHLAHLAHQHDRDPRRLLVQGLALVDAGAPEAAHPPLLMAAEHSSELAASAGLLARACAGETAELAAAIQALEREAARGAGPAAALQLLQAARLAQLLPGCEDREQLLMRAFDANPNDTRVFALLEGGWIQGEQWRRLSNLYRLRTQSARNLGENRDIQVYRRAGTRLLYESSSPALGVRLLQQAVAEIYKRQLEDTPNLIAILSLIVEQLVDTGARPSAVRLLAQGLAHPRSDDEIMWIVNNGIALSAGDAALNRTAATFKALREHQMAKHPQFRVPPVDDFADELTVDLDAAEDIEIEFDEILDFADLDAIGYEIEELTRPSGLGASVADRLDIVADVNIALRARLVLGTRKLEAMTRDLSATGLFLACNAALGLGDSLRLAILLPSIDDWSMEEHEIEGIVARVESGVGYGIRFTQVSESYLAAIRVLAGT